MTMSITLDPEIRNRLSEAAEKLEALRGSL